MADLATELTPEQRINAWAERHGVTMQATFIPWSQSRSKDDRVARSDGTATDQPRYSLNWRVTLARMAMIDGAYKPGSARTILTTDYSQGVAHIPGYDKIPGIKTSVWADGLIKQACEHGWAINPKSKIFHGPKLAGPKLADVLYSLQFDASAIDAGGFESWAADLGYDTDSRKAETIYRACLDIGLKLRAALGDQALRELAEACQDY